MDKRDFFISRNRSNHLHLAACMISRRCYCHAWWRETRQHHNVELPKPKIMLLLGMVEQNSPAPEFWISKTQKTLHKSTTQKTKILYVKCKQHPVANTHFHPVYMRWLLNNYTKVHTLKNDISPPSYHNSWYFSSSWQTHQNLSRHQLWQSRNQVESIDSPLG